VVVVVIIPIITIITTSDLALPTREPCATNQRAACCFDSHNYCLGWILIFVMSDLTQENVKTVSIADLLPTQVTVGMQEVDFKRRRWREKNSVKAASYLSSHSIPVILGPETRLYIIDRHHLTRALHEEGVSEVPAFVVADMNAFSFEEFWSTLECRGCAHPFDDEGKRRSYDDMPKTVFDLTDDPFRSLVGALKRAGGYAKDKAPFSEFRWADFLRSRIERETVECDFDGALALAIDLAQSRETITLPGWLGPTSINGVRRFAPPLPLKVGAAARYRHPDRLRSTLSLQGRVKQACACGL
jgi:hypothetical protein